MSTLQIDNMQVGDKLPTRTHLATAVGLFLYNAAIWNPHRIHYDAAYTTDVEGHPGVVIDGPLQGDWLSQVALNWVADQGTLVRFSYSNRRAAYLGDVLSSGGQIIRVDKGTGCVDLELFIRNASGEIITPGSATIKLSA